MKIPDSIKIGLYSVGACHQSPVKTIEEEKK